MALNRLISSLLFGVSAADTITLLSLSLITLAVAITATYIPARRASAIDPKIALRHD